MGAYRQEYLRTRCTYVLEESYLPDCCGHTENTNFFRAFTTSSMILAIYIKQFWNTMCFSSSTGLYSCQLDEQWFNLHKYVLRDALDITPTNDNNPYVAPPSSDTVIEYVNSLGYPSTLRNISAMSAKTPCALDSLRKNLATASRRKKKTTHLLIPNVRFTKLIIHHLKTKHNIYPRTGLPLHYSHDENVLNTLRFFGKDGREIFGMPIPDALLTDEIKVAPYYSEYQEHVAKYQQYLDVEHGKPKEGGATKSLKATKDAELALNHSEMESDNVASKIDTRDQDEGQAGPNPSDHDEGQAGPNPGVQDEGQARSNPDDAKESQPQSSHVVHNLKFPSKDPVILEEPASSTGILASLQKLKKELSFTDQFFVKKQQEEEPGKTNAEAEVQSMISIPIHQDTSLVPPMTTPVIDLTTSQSGSPLPTSTASTSSIMTTTTILPPPPQPQQSIAYLTLVKRIDELEQNMAILLQYNLALEERLDKHGSRLYKLENLNIPDKESDKSYEAHEDYKKLYDALVKSLERDYSDQLLSDLEEARLKKRKRRDLPKTPSGSPPPQPPPPPPPAGVSGSPGSKAHSSSKSVVSTPQSMDWTTFDTRYKSAGISRTQELSLTHSLIQYDSIPDEPVHLSDDEDSKNNHLPKADSRKVWWKPLPKEERTVTLEPAWTIPSSTVSDVKNNWATALVSAYETHAENSLLAKTGDMMNFLNWYYRQLKKTALIPADLERQAYEVVKAFHPDVIHLEFQMKECHKMLIDQVDWTNPKGDQVRVNVNQPLPFGGPPSHSRTIDFQKAASYPDFGLELLVLEQMWIDDLCTYRVKNMASLTGGLIDRSFILTYMLLRHVKKKSNQPFGFSVSSDLKPTPDMARLSRSSSWFCKMNAFYCCQAMDSKLSDSTAGDFQLVVFPVNNNERKIMRFNEIYKFSDGTLTRILEALAYRVKEFKIKWLNLSMNTRF
nr:hypothetical protein [Tanacetum cinerariifolium]